MEELDRAAPEAASAQERSPVWIVLDDVRSMNNVGSAFRTADGFDVAGIYLSGFTPCPPHREIHKTALGATDTVDWKYAANITDALRGLKEAGYEIWAVEQVHDSLSLGAWRHEGAGKVAFVFGNEVTGVSEEALALCDGCIEIPQWGAKHSLNVSVTVGIVLWEYIKQHKQLGG